MPTCLKCNTGELKRTHRTLAERLRGGMHVYVCSHCGERNVRYKVKNCRRCGTDLDRRRRQGIWDQVAAIALLWPYACRRCAVRRYRWGKRSG